jgi:hypothetical protein
LKIELTENSKFVILKEYTFSQIRFAELTQWVILLLWWLRFLEQLLRCVLVFGGSKATTKTISETMIGYQHILTDHDKRITNLEKECSS